MSTARVAIASERLSVAAARTTSELILFAAPLPKKKSQSFKSTETSKMIITIGL